MNIGIFICLEKGGGDGDGVLGRGTPVEEQAEKKTVTV